jgi:hypothetical protein
MMNRSSNNASTLRAAVVTANQLQVAAVFDKKQYAEEMVEIVSENTNIAVSQMQIIAKGDPQFSEKLEKNSTKIAKSLWFSHLALGTLGFVMGMFCAFLLTNFGPQLAQQNVLFTYIALISPGIFTGLFVAGLLGLRPDRDPLVQTIKNAVRYGNVALVINMRKSQSSSDVVSLLNQHANKTIESLK